MTNGDEGPLPPLLRAAVTELKRPVRLSPDLADRVMAEVRRPAWQRRVRWWLRPRALPVSPLTGLAAAAAVVLLLLRAFGGEAAPAPQAVQVQFVLRAPEAGHVAVVGDFNDWDAGATPLRRLDGGTGIWVVDLPLTPGHHEYAFVVDGGRWVADPAAPAGRQDDFGRPNSILTVLAS